MPTNTPLEPTLNEIKQRLPIEQVVGRRVQLERKGKNLWGLCPFHGEKTPSFSVNSDRGSFKCFGCEKYGDIITFVQELDGLSFMEAVRLLADEAGVELPKMAYSDSRKPQKTKRVREALSRAQLLFAEALHGPMGKAAREYLEERGFHVALWESFGLGWAPSQKGWLENRLIKEGFEIKTLKEAGLIRESSHGQDIYAPFRDRLMFPVIEPGGRVAGFSARYLPGSALERRGNVGKYINSPEGPYFDKSSLLYGLEKLSEGLLKDSKAPIVLTEGNLDVMAMFQAGFSTSVAALGTAFTEKHARVLKRRGRSVVLLFDGDVAGQKAALKASQILVKEDVDFRIAEMPSKQDPADMVKDGKVDELSRLIEEARDIIDWRLSTWSRQNDFNVPAVRASVAQEMNWWVTSTENPVLRQLWEQKVCYVLKISQDVFLRLVGSASSPLPQSDNPKTLSSHKKHSPREVLRLNENEIIVAILKDPSLVSAYEEELIALSLDDEVSRDLLEWSLIQRKNGNDSSLSAALVFFDGKDAISRRLDVIRHSSGQIDFEEILRSALQEWAHNREIFLSNDELAAGDDLSDEALLRLQRKVPFSSSFIEYPD